MPIRKKGMHWFLSDEEVKAVQEETVKLRATMNYEPGKWCLNGMNLKPEVLGFALPNHMPKKVQLRDLTLRVAELTPGVIVLPAERLRLLRALLEIGVSSFELGAPFGKSWEQYQQEIQLIKSMNPKAQVKLCHAEDFETFGKLIDIGANLATFSVPVLSGTESIRNRDIPRAAWEGKDIHNKLRPPTPLKEFMEQKKPLIDYLKKRDVKIEAFVTSMQYATEDWIEEYARLFGNSGVDYLFVEDDVGGMTPQTIGYITNILKRNAPKVTICAHIHNVWNMGVAKILAAVQGGAEIVEVAVNDICFMGGHVDIAQVAGVLEVLYRVDTGIRLDKLTDLRRLGEDIFRIRVPGNWAVTGDKYFTSEHVNINTIDPWVHVGVEASLFGNKFVGTDVGQKANVWDILEKLTELDIPVEKSEVEAILKELKEELQIRKRWLNDDEIRSIAMKVKGVT